MSEEQLWSIPDDIYSMVFTKDITTNKTKIILKENKQ